MSGIIEIRGVKIGGGIPKIIVPIVGVTNKEILDAAASFAEVRHDLVEWRADWFEDASDFEKVRAVLRNLRVILGNTPLLFTFRTSAEGGEKAVSAEEYAQLNLRAAQTGYVDIVDIEAFAGEEKSVRDLIAGVHKTGVKVVASSHDFWKTPEKEEIIRRLRKMQELGADIPKIAVMPRSKKDVLTLLSATEEMAAQYADRPLITMSMGGTGLLSRLCGEVFGSACTFGAVGRTSAPGQMDAADLDTVLQLIHKYG